ncbi:MAG: tRNA (guanosine(37)-N1)-methyltransferase TrmD [Planctomycetes bacterium]|nr:tRNA (guanosine(37)-N1)-methyltransferase TrmD [Planctomycetota bacterium]
MRIDVLTLFPEVFEPFLASSIVGRAIEAGIASVQCVNFREFAHDKHHSVDDRPFGGGPGMVMKPEPIFAATEAVLEMAPERGPIVLMTPAGRKFDHELTVELAAEERLIILSGRYEGFDARVHEHLATHEVSIGDYVLSGGELPAMVLVDAVVRQLPGALGSPDSVEDESFSHGLLEAPHYTRPSEFRGWEVPAVLLSGHHAEVDKWRRRQNLLLTAQRRPDLLERFSLSKEEKEWLSEKLDEAF